MNRTTKILHVKVISLCLVVFVQIMSVMPSQAAPLAGYWNTTKAYKIEVAFWDWGTPHYGAFFSGQRGRSQQFLGPGGNTATQCCSGGIAAWNWSGSSSNALLLPKRWIWGNSLSTAGGYPGSYVPSNYKASLYFN